MIKMAEAAEPGLCGGRVEINDMATVFGYGADVWEAKRHSITVVAPPRVLTPISAMAAAVVDVADYRGKRPVNYIVIPIKPGHEVKYKGGGGVCFERKLGDVILLFLTPRAIGAIDRSNWWENICPSLAAVAETMFHELFHHRGDRGPKHLPKDRQADVVEAYGEYLSDMVG